MSEDNGTWTVSGQSPVEDLPTAPGVAPPPVDERAELDPFDTSEIRMRRAFIAEYTDFRKAGAPHTTAVLSAFQCSCMELTGDLYPDAVRMLYFMKHDGFLSDQDSDALIAEYPAIREANSPYDFESKNVTEVWSSPDGVRRFVMKNMGASTGTNTIRSFALNHLKFGSIPKTISVSALPVDDRDLLASGEVLLLVEAVLRDFVENPPQNVEVDWETRMRIEQLLPSVLELSGLLGGSDKTILHGRPSVDTLGDGLGVKVEWADVQVEIGDDEFDEAVLDKAEYIRDYFLALLPKDDDGEPTTTLDAYTPKRGEYDATLSDLLYDELLMMPGPDAPMVFHALASSFDEGERIVRIIAGQVSWAADIINSLNAD